MVTPIEGLRRLEAAAESGELSALCERHGIRIVTVFGSIGRGEDNPRDLDVAVLTEQDNDFDLLQARADFEELADVHDDNFDFAHLNNGGPVIRENALIGSIGLYEAQPGEQLERGTAAAMERMDTDWLRRLNLKLLAR
ncbi:nucleotidyltransferase family protein [Haloactinomyces albus]|uniref:Nucleotidyltransferase n=1 Tax=Haloactinomyces albus TaxID=1352928 RepID=A0AAE4CL32_9ACTN|nr:nucleotidyltransferase domain-containing protein [Haloactinomyces albus]MDR7301359.1 putative nucleotidyltransferase [Haloactinomyces albus]